MIILTSILGVLLIAAVSYLWFTRSEIEAINKQLQHINDHDTNAEITHTSRSKVITTLVFQMNRMLRRTKHLERKRFEQEHELYATLSSLSHDLKTPLTTAYGYTQIVQGQHSENTLLPKVVQSLEETTAYLDYIVDYTSISERQSAMNYESVHISNVLSQHILQYYDSLTQAGIEPNLDTQANVFLISDTLFIQRIISNLLGNVIKYADKMCSIQLTQAKDGAIDLIVLNDTNKSIDDVNLLQQRFITGDTSRSNKSVGLGLDIIQKCTEILNGETAITYEQGIFKVHIHLKSAQDFE